jgi:hypothetical protein
MSAATNDKEQATMRVTGMILVATALSAVCFAQAEEGKKPPPAEKKSYRLDVVVKELDGGKTVNSREYFMLVSSGQSQASLRTGTQVPYGPEDKRSYQYVGVRFDCRDVAPTAAGEVSMNLTADISVIPEGDTKASTAGPPVLRNNQWNARAPNCRLLI